MASSLAFAREHVLPRLSALVAGAEAAVCALAAKPTSKAHNHSAGTNGFSQGVSFDKRAINCITFEHLGTNGSRRVYRSATAGSACP